MGKKKHVILSEIASGSLSPSQAGKVPVYNPTTNDFDLGAGGGGGNLYYQAECPVGYTPDEIPLGSFWYNSVTGVLYVRIHHESSGQYLWVTPSLECCGGVSFFYRNTCPDIQPGEILPGSLWYNSETGILAIYIYDADSDQYIWSTPAVNCCDGGSGATGPTGPQGPQGPTGSGFADLANDIRTPNNEDTITLSSSKFSIINPASSIASLNIILPSVSDGTRLYVKFCEDVIAVNWSGTGGDTIKGINNGGAITAGILIVWTYNSATTSWL